MKNITLKFKIIESFGTQFRFARELNIPEDRLSKFICGRLVPNETERITIAEKLGVSVGEIFPAH